jgi:tetratricopeptide (TPR) repeat protein
VAELTRGTVADRPWGRTMFALGARGLTGQLTLAADGRRYCVAFYSGAVVGATSPLALDAASRVALQAGLISSTQVPDIARYQAAQPQRDEVELVLEVARLPPEHAPRLRRRVVAARAARTFAIERGDFVVHDQIAIPVEQAGLDVRTVISHGARTHMPDARLAAELATFGDWFALLPAAQRDLPQFAFGPADQPILELLGIGATLRELESASHNLDARSVRAIVYALASCGLCATDPNARGEPDPVAPRPSTTRMRPVQTGAPAGRAGASQPPPMSSKPATGTLPVATPPAGARGLQPMQPRQTPGSLPVASPPKGLQPMSRGTSQQMAAVTPSGRPAGPAGIVAPSRVVRTTAVTPSHPEPALDDNLLDLGGGDDGGDGGDGSLDLEGGGGIGDDGMYSDDGAGSSLDLDAGGGGGMGMSDDMLTLDGPDMSAPPARGRGASSRAPAPSGGGLPPPRAAAGIGASRATPPPTRGGLPPPPSPRASGPAGITAPSRAPGPAGITAPSRAGAPSGPGGITAPSRISGQRAAVSAPGTAPPQNRAAAAIAAAAAVSSARARNSGPSAPRALSRAPVKPEQVAEIRALIDAKGRLLHDDADHFALLGVDQNAPDPDIRKSYFALARQLHPDRLAALGITDDAHAIAHRVFAQINAAFAVLSNNKQRNDYMQILARGGAKAVRQQDREAEQLYLRAMQAEEAFNRGEGALRADQIPAAVRELSRAVELDPDEADYQAALAWAKFLTQTDRKAASPNARHQLEAAARKKPESATPRLYLGRLERMLGNDQMALRHFKKVLELEPGNAQATSEARLIESRLGGGSAKRR